MANTNGAPNGFHLTITQTFPTYRVIRDETIMTDTGLAEGQESTATFTLPNGAECIFELWTLEAGGAKLGGSPLRLSRSMQAIQPRKIENLDGSVSTDGRHRTFTFTVPDPRGANLTSIIIRRNDRTSATAPEHDYVIMCPTPGWSSGYAITCDSIALGAGTAAGTTSAADAICYDALTCEQDATMTVTVGSNLFPGDAWYIDPMQTYSWAAIGAASTPSNALSRHLAATAAARRASHAPRESPRAAALTARAPRPARASPRLTGINSINNGCNSDGGYGSCDGVDWGWSDAWNTLQYTQGTHPGRLAPARACCAPLGLRATPLTCAYPRAESQAPPPPTARAWSARP